MRSHVCLVAALACVVMYGVSACGSSERKVTSDAQGGDGGQSAAAGGSGHDAPGGGDSHDTGGGDAGAQNNDPNRPPVFTSEPELDVVVQIAAEPDFSTIELTPLDVASKATAVFSTLPSADPALFGLDGADVRAVNFDTTPAGDAIPSGTEVGNTYASLGVRMPNVVVSNNAYEGAASPPNATTSPFQPGYEQRFVFDVPVVALGVVNTSPDQNIFEFYDVAGQLIYSTKDQADAPGPNYNVDRFVGARSNNDRLIGSMLLVNTTGQMELDELIFEVSSAQLAESEWVYELEATDPDGDALTFDLVSGPDGATLVDTTVRWTATNFLVGEHTFVLRVEDGRGGESEQTFTVTVQLVEQP